MGDSAKFKTHSKVTEAFFNMVWVKIRNADWQNKANSRHSAAHTTAVAKCWGG